ncbi:MAG: hypothetical protein E7168_05310 [Firmicutes bacterium]|nr:hypothetical protein [Bacillota bacterium]
MNQVKSSKIWERILETGNIEELDFLLHLVLSDEESIQVILKKLSSFVEEEPLKIKVEVNNIP